MKKSDLKDGMIVKFEGEKDGNLVCGSRFEGLDGHMNISDYNEDLEYMTTHQYISDKHWNIECVYKMKSCGVGLIKLLRDVKNNRFIERIWERPKQREINWYAVPKWTKVQVRASNTDVWVNRYLVKKTDDSHHSFIASLNKPDNFTGYDGNIWQYWNECRIHPSIEIKEEWYK